MTTTQAAITKSRGARAREFTFLLFLVGFLGAVIGGYLAVSQSPETTAGLYGTTDTSGSDGGYAAGLMLLGLGSALTFIATVSWGVMLGMRSADD